MWTDCTRPTAANEVIIDDDGPPAKDPGASVKDPVPPTPVKKRDPKRDARKDKPVEPVPEPNLERLEPFDRGRALSPYSKDVEVCRAANSAARGSVANVKFKVEGATGKVLEAVPLDTSAAARCIAKVVKTKVKFPRFKLKVQEFNFRFQM